jgi:hypothetical protein
MKSINTLLEPTQHRSQNLLSAFMVTVFPMCSMGQSGTLLFTALIRSTITRLSLNKDFLRHSIQNHVLHSTGYYLENRSEKLLTIPKDGVMFVTKPNDGSILRRDTSLSVVSDANMG